MDEDNFGKNIIKKTHKRNWKKKPYEEKLY